MVTPPRSEGPRPAFAGTAAGIVAPLVVAMLVVLIVWPGLMPGVGYWDTAEFQTILPVMGTAHPTGYPTYVLLGFVANLLLTPIGEPAFRMNVLSLLCVAAAAGATMRLVGQLTGIGAIAAAAGLGVALAPATWRLATHADPHTLHLALLAILLALLVRWEIARRNGEARADRWLAAAVVAYGLSVGNHALTLLLAVPVGLYVLSVHPGIVLRPRLMALCAALMAGTVVAVYLELPLRAGIFRAPLVYGRPDTWDGFWYIALAEQFRGSLHDPLGELPRKLGELTALTVTQFGPLAALIPIGFVTTAARHWRYALLTGSAALITVIFNASYANADIGRYYLGPMLMAWTWLGVLGATVAERLGWSVPGETVSGDWPGDTDEGGPTAIPGARLVALVRGPMIAGALGAALLIPTAVDLAVRADQADLSHDTSARQWVDAVLGHVEPDAVVVSWWSTSTVLWYAQYVDHLRPDITVVDDRTRLDLDYGEATDVIARFLDERPVYVIRANHHDLELVRERYDLELLDLPPIANVYRVLGPRGAGG